MQAFTLSRQSNVEGIDYLISQMTLLCCINASRWRTDKGAIVPRNNIILPVKSNVAGLMLISAMFTKSVFFLIDLVCNAASIEWALLDQIWSLSSISAAACAAVSYVYTRRSSKNCERWLFSTFWIIWKGPTHTPSQGENRWVAFMSNFQATSSVNALSVSKDEITIRRFSVLTDDGEQGAPGHSKVSRRVSVESLCLYIVSLPSHSAEFAWYIRRHLWWYDRFWSAYSLTR